MDIIQQVVTYGRCEVCGGELIVPDLPDKSPEDSGLVCKKCGTVAPRE